jgi:hypothetical protein
MTATVRKRERPRTAAARAAILRAVEAEASTSVASGEVADMDTMADLLAVRRCSPSRLGQPGVP